jgi:hypothetical protein
MNNEELRKGLDELRGKLAIIDTEMQQGQPPEEAVHAVEEAVSAARANVWTLLTARHSDDYEGYLTRTRIRRATEVCEDILADLHADTLSPHMVGLEVFRATLRELSDTYARMTGTAPHLGTGGHDE